MRTLANPKSLRVPATLLFIALLVPAAVGAKGNAELWTEAGKRRARPITLPSVAPLVERVEPASLVIMTEAPPESAQRELPPGHPPLPGRDGPVQGQGSGFLIHPTGYALTNHHVIENAIRIRVRVGASRVEVPARVVGTDPRTDVALIKLEGDRRDWPVIPLGDSDTLKVGDFVVAIGNPFGLEQSVSMGILSARSRRDVNPSGRMGLYDFLQTDASINFGNSGGPLMNLSGEVVGMNTAINAAAQGIGFAIPVNMIKRMLPSLDEYGRVVRAWIGVGIQPVSPELARSFGLERPAGALVRQVLEGGPAADAGIVAGDVIVRFGTHPIDDANELPLLAGDAGVGQSVKLSLLREGKPKTVELVLGEHPENLRPATDRSSTSSGDNEARPRGLGIGVVTLDGDDRTRLGLDEEQRGARIIKVEFGSPAFHGGLMADDVIMELNGKLIASAQELQLALVEVPSGEVLRLQVWREGNKLFVPVKKP
ncbi:MAG: trypsin-like peptidase domain-containing protein [Myxococcota bacterium]